MVKKFLFLQLFLISILAVVSKYTVPDLSDSNWTTALFLTPSGILTNFIQKNETVLWSFYSDVSSGQVSLSTMQVIGMLVIYLIMINSVVLFIRSYHQTAKSQA